MSAALRPEEQAEVMQELSSTQIAHLREKFETDLYFGAKGVLGYDQLDPEAHLALCAFMVQEECNRRMVLMPRGFLKSTICTISDSIRLSCKNPNIRILIQNEVFDRAAGFLHELKQHWEKGPILRALYPELIPERLVGPGSDWSKASASLNRDTIKKESTYTASGSGGSPQSQHFEVIKNDDLIGEKARLSEVEMKKSIEWVGAMRPLLDRLEDQLDYYGTRKTLADVYQHVMDTLGDQVKVFIREPIENGRSIFKKFTLAGLQDIMIQTPDVWAYDYMNNPVGTGGLDWGKGYLREFEFRESDGTILLQDHKTGLWVRWKLSECDIVITADPNSGKPSAPDKAACVAHAVTPRDQICVLETRAGRWTPDGFIDQIWDMAGRWHPRVVGIEDAGQQNTLYYFEKKMRDEGWYYFIQPLKHKNIEKDVRIRTALDTPLKARRVYVQAEQTELVTQIQLHPQLAAHNWDLIDCFSYGPQLYRSGLSEADQVEQEEAEAKVLQMRGITGYGASV